MRKRINMDGSMEMMGRDECKRAGEVPRRWLLVNVMGTD